MKRGLKRWLSRTRPAAFTAAAGLAGFCAYFSMYAFRKPFTAAPGRPLAGAAPGA